jgi:predicted metal-binding protein
MKKVLMIIVMLIGFVCSAQEPVMVPVQIETIEVDGFVQYSRDNGTVLIERETTNMYEINSPIRFQEGNVYTFFLKPKNCIECTTIEAELVAHTFSIEQAEINLAKMRAKHMTETPKHN